MKCEIEINDEVLDEVIVVDLKNSLAACKDYDPADPEERRDLRKTIKALKRVIEYYGG